MLLNRIRTRMMYMGKGNYEGRILGYARPDFYDRWVCKRYKESGMEVISQCVLQNSGMAKSWLKEDERPGRIVTYSKKIAT